MYVNEHIEDFHPPKFQQCDEIYSMIRGYARDGKQVAIHCAAGMGRTGTVLAAIKLNELMNDPDRVLKAEGKTSMLKVSGLGGNKPIPCTPLVREAVDAIRSASSDSKDSVEVEKQIEMLCEYQSILFDGIELRKSQAERVDKSPKSLDFLEHEGIKIASEIIHILKEQPCGLTIIQRLQIMRLERQIKKLSALPNNSPQAIYELNKLVTIAFQITSINQESSERLDRKKTSFAGEHAPEEKSVSLKGLFGPLVVRMYELKRQIMNFLNGTFTQAPDAIIAKQRETISFLKQELDTLRSSQKSSTITEEKSVEDDLKHNNSMGS